MMTKKRFTIAVVLVILFVAALLLFRQRNNVVAPIVSTPELPSKTTTPPAAPEEARATPPLPSPPAQAENVQAQKHDFNGDGVDEVVVYYTEPIQLAGRAHTKQRFFVYRLATDTWVVDHEDEGTSDVLDLDAEYFFTPFDLDGDGVEEAQIEKRRSGTGQYRQWYILKWDGRVIADIFYPREEEVRNAAQRFVRTGESLGAVAYQGKKGSIPICTAGDNFCESRQTAANPQGFVDFTMTLDRDIVVAQNFARRDIVARNTTPPPAPPSDERTACIAGGGTPSTSGSSCRDTCAWHREYTRIIQSGDMALCTTDVVFNCDCGPAQCWDGARCVQNPTE